MSTHGVPCRSCCDDCAGLGAPPAPKAAANAFTLSFIADLEAAPQLKEAIIRRQLDGRGLANIIYRDVDRGRRRMPGPALFPNVRKVAGMILRSEGELSGGLGQWDAIASAISAAAGAAASIYGAKITTDAQKKLISLEAQKNQAAIQIAELQAKAAQTQLAAANVSAGNAPDGSALTVGTLGPAISGVPILPVAAGAIALAVGVYFVAKKG